MKSLPILLAIDFDETIVHSHPFPRIKGLRKGAKKYINKLVSDGYYITIWTCRTDKGDCNDEADAITYLNEQGIMYHQVNDNHIALQKCFKNNCRKIATDLYIDDKGLWLFGLPSWFWLYWIIRFKSFRLKPNKKILAHCRPEHFTTN
jgi:hypothetical protein